MDLAVLERSPDAGDPESVDGLVAGFVARAERFGERATGVRTAAEALVAGSVGSWVDALAQRSGRLAAGLDDAAQGCRQVAQVLASYGETLRDLRRRSATSRDDVDAARARAIAAREHYAAATAAVGGSTLGWSWADVPFVAATPAARDELDRWRAAVADVAAGLQAFEVCCREREDLDRDTAQRLAGVDLMAAYAPGTGVDAIVDVPLVGALSAASVGTVTAEQGRLLAGWFGDAVEAVSDDPEDEAAAAALTGFLTAWQHDSATMATVFAAAGGKRIAQVLSELGHARLVGSGPRNVAVVSTADALRSGLATASRSWTTETARDFAAGMVDAARTRRGTLSVIGYLFADPTGERMGETFTVAVADQLDAVERELGLAWREESGSIGQGLTTRGDPTAGVAVHDPAVHVLTTLATYPQAARDWLTMGYTEWAAPQSALDTSRMAHWFGVRDWSEGPSDGFAAIGGLWAEVQVSELQGPRAEQAAAINLLAFQELAKNPAFVPGQVSASGATSVASAVSAQLPGLIEVGIARSATRSEDVVIFSESVHVPYLKERITTAKIDVDWVGPLLRAATSDPAGKEIIAESVLDYQERALAAAWSPDGASPGTVLDRLAVTWGAVDGASVSAAEVERYEHDVRVRSGLELTRSPVDGGVTLSRISPMASHGVDLALNELQKLAEASLTNRPLPDWSTTSSFPSGVELLDDFFMHAVDGHREAGLWDKEGVHAGDTDSTSAEAVAQEYVERYKSTVDAMRARGMDDVKEPR